MDLVHLVVANKPHPGLTLCRESAARIGLHTRVLGLGTRAAIGHKNKVGFGLKLELLQDAVHALHPHTPVLFTDAFDVLLQGTAHAAAAWIEANPGRVLFAAERSKWPDPTALYPVPLRLPCAYLNSGGILGRAGDIRALFRAPFDMGTDDQGYYTEKFLRDAAAGHAHIVLDHECAVFACLQAWNSDDIQFKDGAVLVRTSKSQPWRVPLVLHLNNGATRKRWTREVARAVLGDGAETRRLALDAWSLAWLGVEARAVPFWLSIVAVLAAWAWILLNLK